MAHLRTVSFGLLHNIFLHRDTIDSSGCIRLRGKEHHHKYLPKIVRTILLLELRLYFVNYDPVFSSYNCILGVKIVLLMQCKL